MEMYVHKQYLTNMQTCGTPQRWLGRVQAVTLDCLMRFATRCNTQLNFLHKYSPYIISAYMLAR